jgi:ribosomal protein S18 acetylase RimI-like enzyme
MPEVTVRPITPADRHAVKLAFRRLSPSARYARWLTPRRELSGKELDGLLSADGWHHHGVIAWAAGRHLPVGFASCVRTAQFSAAEVAVAVIDDVQRSGVGWQMVQELVKSARSAGIDTLVASVHVENVAARAMLRKLGKPRTVARSGGALEMIVGLGSRDAGPRDAVI